MQSSVARANALSGGFRHDCHSSQAHQLSRTSDPLQRRSGRATLRDRKVRDGERARERGYTGLLGSVDPRIEVIPAGAILERASGAFPRKKQTVTTSEHVRGFSYSPSLTPHPHLPISDCCRAVCKRVRRGLWLLINKYGGDR